MQGKTSLAHALHEAGQPKERLAEDSHAARMLHLFLEGRTFHDTAYVAIARLRRNSSGC